MFCINCGKEIDDNSKYCCFCGKETTSIIGDESNKMISGMDKPLFLKELERRALLEKVFSIVTNIIEIIAFLVMASYLYEQYQLDEGYVFWIYIIRFMVRFAFLLLILSLMQFFSELLKCKASDLRKLELKNTWLVCKIVILVANVVIIYPFIGVSDGTLAGWVLRLAFVGIEEFFYEFRLQCLAYLISIIIGVYVNKCIETNKSNKEA